MVLNMLICNHINYYWIFFNIFLDYLTLFFSENKKNYINIYILFLFGVKYDLDISSSKLKMAHSNCYVESKKM